MIKVAVVVPTLHNRDGGYQALQSIQGAYNIFWMPIIIDNWREPRSVAQSWNMGFDIARQYRIDYVLVINDDVLFSPWTLTGLVKTFEKTNAGVVTGMNWRGQLANPEDIFRIEIPSYTNIDIAENPDFACFMMEPSTWEKVGPFDENFIPAYFEDNDYHYRMKLLEIKAVCSSWAPYYHIGSITQNFSDTPACTPEQFQRNEAYYRTKWGAPAMFELFTNPYNDMSCSPSRWRILGDDQLNRI